MTAERVREWSKVARFVVCAPKSTRVTQKHVTYASFVAQRLTCA